MLEEIKKKISAFIKSEDKEKLVLVVAVIILLVLAGALLFVFKDFIIGGLSIVVVIALLFGDSIKRAYERNVNGNTCNGCIGCQSKYGYVNQLVYEALLSLRKIYDLDVPRSAVLIRSPEPDTPMFDSKMGFPADLPRCWFKALWGHIKTADELDSFDIEEFRTVLRSELTDLFKTHYMWFMDSPITGLWVDLVRIDAHCIRIMVVPYCEGVTGPYLEAHYAEEFARDSSQKSDCTEVVYDDELE